MSKIKITDINNTKVIKSEIDEEYEGLCGGYYAVLWEDSLEQFFAANDIEIEEFQEGLYIVLEQDGKRVIFPLIKSNYGSEPESDHVNFNVSIPLN